MNTSFQLHPQLAADTSLICDLPLCRTLLMRDARYPWVILVPRVESLRELHKVPAEHQTQLWHEIVTTSSVLEQYTGADKMNVAALGNQVPQLHVHVIARFTLDPAWPGPVWGVGEQAAYPDGEAERICTDLNRALQARVSG